MTVQFWELAAAVIPLRSTRLSGTSPQNQE
jgi:hypothetical protein